MNSNNFKVTFTLDDIFLVKLCIRDYESNRFNGKAINYEKSLIIDFQNLAWNQSEQYYKTICNKWDSDKYDNNISEYLNTLVKSKLFQKIRIETKNTIPILEEEWSTNLTKTNEYISSLGILLKENFTVYVDHPIFLQGQYWGNGVILWSYRNDYPNYNTIYVWHEILHSVFGKSDREHALIELITDNEMRRLLNGTRYPPFNGHKDLENIKQELNPKFQKYLINPNESVISILG